MFIEITEYHGHTADSKIGKAIINTEDILFIDEFEQSPGHYRVKMKQDEYAFSINEETYAKLKGILVG